MQPVMNFLNQIKNLTLEDADVYKCIASNKHGDATYSVSLIVTESESCHFILHIV